MSIIRVLSILFFYLFLKDIYATHGQGADISYECLGNNQYRVRFRFYRDCRPGSASIPTTASLELFNSCTNATSNVTMALNTGAPCPNGGTAGTAGCEVSPLCPAQLSQSQCANPNNPLPGVQVAEFTSVITLPSACNSWLVRFSLCCRNISTNMPNMDSQNLTVEAMINNTIDPATGQPYCNSSATFSEPPVPFKCINQPTTFNHGAVEPNGDSLRYVQINPLGGGFTPITTYNPGYSLTQPIRTNPVNSFTFDPTSGQMTFRPSQQEVDVLAVRVDEYRNGVLIGYVMRDIQVKMIPCTVSTPDFATNLDSLNNATIIDTTSFSGCPGTPINFSVLMVDRANKNLTVTSTLQTGVNSPLPGAVFTTQNVGTAPNDSVRARVTWTPAASDTGCRSFIITAKNDDCPINGSNTRVFKACILKKVTVTPKTAVYCGTPIQLTSTGGTNFSWSPPAGLDNPNSYTPLASPSVNTVYRFTSDCGTDSAVIISNPPFSMDAGPGGPICRNGQLPLNATVDNTYAPYQIRWVPSAGLLDPITGLPSDSVLNPIASPSTTTRYTVFFTGSNGCVRTDTVTVNVAGVAPAVQAFANPNAVCPGTPVTLTLRSSPSNCGIPLAPCVGNNVDAQIGTATTIQGGGGTIYPSIYGNNRRSARHQILIKAAELQAVLGGGGQINSLQTFIGTLNSNTTLQNFTISMGCTRLDSLTGYAAGLTQVFNPKNVTPILGANNHVLDQPYDWDGVSDLVVDFCFNSSTNGTINNKNVYTTTPYRSIWFTADNTSTQCGNTGTHPTTSATFYFQRPNIRFNVCLPSLDNANIAWTPNSGPNAPSPLNNDTVVATPVSPTRYTAAVTNQAGCVGNSFVFVNVDTSLRLDVRPDTFICSITPVQLRANMTGSPLPGQQFTYTWSASVGAAPPSGIGAGFANPIVNPTVPTVYTCVVTGGACVQRDTAFVIVGTGLPVGVNVDSIRCFGQSTGKIRAVPLGGSPPLSYVWSPSLSSTDSIVNLAPNTYSVTVTDALGCSGSATATLSQPPLLTLTLDSLNVTCNNAANGQLTATVAGGTPGYTYTWSPAGPNSPTRTSLSPALYSLTVSDQNGCSVTRSRNITQPTALNTSVVTYNVSANGGSDGSAKVTASGGTPPYTYTWSPGGGSTDSIFGRTAGTYFVTVCDARQCCRVDTAVITDPPPIILNFQKTDNVCFGDSNGTASVSALGGVAPYDFTWSNGTVGNATNGLAAGTYFVTVEDDNGVTVRGSITITQPSLLTVSLDSVSILCFGGNNGSITATPNGGSPQYTYVWSNTLSNSALNGNLSAGTYTLTIFDAFQCSVTASKTLNEPPLLDASLVSTNSTSCFGASDGSATISVVGGTPNYNYAWSVGAAPNAATANVFPAGAHAVVVTDDNGCRDTVNFTIIQPTQLQVQISPTNANCTTSNDGSALATVSGGTTPYQYTWDGTAGPNPRTGLASGNHTLIVEDDNGCSVTENFVVGTNYTLQLAIANTPTSCNGGNDGTATVTPQNGNQTYTYVWSVPGNTATIQSSAQTVSVTVTDGVGCIASANTTISEPSAISLTTGNIPPSCNGRFDGKAWVLASGGVGNYSYAWSNLSGSDTLRNISAGNYDVTVFDGNQCSATTTVSVFNPLSLTARFEQVGITCFDAADGSGQVIASGGTSPYDYEWSDNFIGANRTNIAPGSYQITVSDNNKCDTVLNVSFDAPPGIQFALISVDSISCPRFTDGKILIDAIGGSPGATVPYTYSLDGITFQNSRLFEDLPAGPHRVYVKDGNGCVRDTLIIIESPAELVFSIEPQDSTIGLGKSLQLDIRTNNYPSSNIQAYTWSTSEGLSCADCRNPVASPYYNTDYTLSVTYGYNCLATNSVKVFVGPEPDYYMPNAFSPNGDGNNDIIMLFGASLKTVNLTIFNRWGEKVFESSNQWEGWDGTYKGQQMGPGIYTYVADLEYLNGKKKRDFGSITLIR